MELSTARCILEALADAVNPMTGELIESGPLVQPQVVRALCRALQSLDGEIRRAERVRDSPPNTGKGWNQEEDKSLSQLFDAGATPAEIARTLGRTVGGITRRLEITNKVPAGHFYHPSRRRQNAPF
jgi:hypothetical protein